VLAIGIVVDDAIVVVEAVHAKMAEFPNISPYQAVKRVLGEISGAIIAITAVMVSVFFTDLVYEWASRNILSTVFDYHGELDRDLCNHCTDSYSCTLCYATQE